MNSQVSWGRLKYLLSFACLWYSTNEGSALAESLKENCSVVRNYDTVRNIPKELLNDARRLYGDRSADDRWLMASTVYRCMNGRLRLCNAGANIICAKPDRRHGSPEIAAFCHEHPGSDIVPMSVTGHGVLYGWKCVGSRPVINYTADVDARGFIENVWTPID